MIRLGPLGRSAVGGDRDSVRVKTCGSPPPGAGYRAEVGSSHLTPTVANSDGMSVRQRLMPARERGLRGGSRSQLCDDVGEDV